MKTLNIKNIFFFLSIIMLVLSGCSNKGDEIVAYTCPAIVGFDSDVTNQPTLLTPYGTYIAPELQEVFLYYLNKGDALLVTYEINYDNQLSEDYTIVHNLDWVKVNNESLKATVGGESVTGDFDAPILSVNPYVRLGGVLFVIFAHSSAQNQPYLYEMTYDYTDMSEIPTVYFRAKEAELNTSLIPIYPNAAAFDMSNFLMSNVDSENKVKINIKVKTGKDDDGKDVYSDFAYNPVEFDMSK